MCSVWDQIIAVDARYKNYRLPQRKEPQLRTLYLRRRTQLLRETHRSHAAVSDPAQAAANRRRQVEYIRIRERLLRQRFGPVAPPSEVSSVRSRSISLRSLNRMDADLSESWLISAALTSPASPAGMRRGITADSMHDVVPTRDASASRALAGGHSTSEQYAFAGFHHIFDQHLDKPVVRLRFANNEADRVALGSHDGCISICRLRPDPTTMVTLKGHSAEVTDLCWSDGNDLLISVAMDGSARLWKVATGDCLREFSQLNCGRRLFTVAFQPINNNLFLVGGDRQLHMFNLSTGKPVKGGQGRMPGPPVLSAAFESSTGRCVWAGDATGVIQSFLCDVSTGRLTARSRLSVGPASAISCPISSIQFRAWLSREARDPCLLVNAGGASQGLFLFRVVSADGQLAVKRKFAVRHTNDISLPVRSSFCPLMSFREGACVVTGSADAAVLVLDVHKERQPCVNKLQGHAAPVLDVAMNHEESLLASSDAAGMVIIWRRM